MKKIAITVLILLLSGCAETMAVLDILVLLRPKPVCDKDSAGTVWQGRTCLKFSDGYYYWETNK